MEQNMEVSANNEFLTDRTTVDHPPQDVHFTAWFGLLGVLLSLLVAFNLNYFTIRRVIVKGNHTVATETIVLATRLSQRQNLLTLDCSEIVAAIARNPQIAAVRVEKYYPNRLVIAVRERRPVCLLRQGRVSYIVGDDFKIMGRAAEGDPKSLPVITGVKVRRHRGGLTLDDLQVKTLGELLQVVVGVPRLMIRQVDLARALMILEVTDNPGPITVLLGDSSRIREKVAQLRAVLAVNSDGDIVSIDLRIPGISTVTTSKNKIP